MTETHLDRWGRSVPRPATTPEIPRDGAFAMCMAAGRFLAIHPPYAPDVPELPGGGREEGETFSQALCREFMEETGLEYPAPPPDPFFEQTVRFYADDQDEFWIYHQKFYRFDRPDSEIFTAPRPTPEGGNMVWRPLTASGFHALHRRALASLSS